MKYEQVYTAAELNCNCLADRDCIKLYVESSIDDPSAAGVLAAFQTEVEKHHIYAEVIATGPFGYYDLTPLVIIDKTGQPPILYNNVSSEKAFKLANDYLLNNNPDPTIAFSHMGSGKINGIPSISDLPLFRLQNRIALRNCGYIDPQNIDHYILHNHGYRGLDKALRMSRREVIDEIGKYELTGQQREIFLTADRWEIYHEQESSEKYVICNAVESYPAARTIRLILESDPHSFLEGMLIAAYAIGASQCIVAVNAEYGYAIERLEKALNQMRGYSLLGHGILDSSYTGDIAIKEVPASLIAGEETALLSYLEEKPAMPFIRTTYPAIQEFSGKPALVEDLETMSKVSAIFQNSSEWSPGHGNEKSRESKVITLSGSVIHKYTVEIPYGASLRSIIEDIGGGVAPGKNIKALQLGGPTGSYFSDDSLDIPIDDKTIKENFMVGSGTVELFDSESCVVERTKEILSYIQAESCGKCVFCREGSLQMADILQDIYEYQGKPQDLDLLIELGKEMKIGCICELGRTAPNPVLSSIKLFRDEYEVHIKEKRCSNSAQY